MLALLSCLIFLSIIVLLLDWQVDTNVKNKLDRGETLGPLTPPRYRQTLDTVNDQDEAPLV